MDISTSVEPNAELGTPRAVVVQTAELQALHDRRQDPHSNTPRYVLNPSDQSIAIDHKGQPITVDRILATKPLKSDLHSRRGPGGRNLVYYNGETVSRLLNDIFGFDGWNMSVLNIERICCVQEKEKWQVGYMAHVRITHRNSGTFKEDMGSGDSIDKHMPTAVQNSVKGAITDAMKRAARHFGEKLGNSLYSDGFSMNSCPKTLAEALNHYDRSQAEKFQSLKSPQDTKPTALGGEQHVQLLSKQTVAPEQPGRSAAQHYPQHNNPVPLQKDTYGQDPNRTGQFFGGNPLGNPQSVERSSIENDNKRTSSAVTPASACYPNPSNPPQSSYGNRNMYKKAKINPYA